MTSVVGGDGLFSSAGLWGKQIITIFVVSGFGVVLLLFVLLLLVSVGLLIFQVRFSCCRH